MRLSRETLSSHLRSGTKRRLTRTRVKSRLGLQISRTRTQRKPVATPARVMRPSVCRGKLHVSRGESMELHGFRWLARDQVPFFAAASWLETTCRRMGQGTNRGQGSHCCNDQGPPGRNHRLGSDLMGCPLQRFPPFPTSFSCATATNCMRPLLVAAADSVLQRSKGPQKHRPRGSKFPCSARSCFP